MKFSLQSKLSTKEILDKLKHSSLFDGEVDDKNFELKTETGYNRQLSFIVQGEIIPGNDGSKIKCALKPSRNLRLFAFFFLALILISGVTFSLASSGMDLFTFFPFILLVCATIFALVFTKIETSRIKADLIELLEAEMV